jgi:DNA polymerase III epsilon subunit family exonuclease
MSEMNREEDHSAREDAQEHENPDVPEIRDRSWIPLSQQVDLAGDASRPFSPKAIMHEGPVIVLDTETTGLDHKTESLLEIGAVRLENGEITATFSTLIKPAVPIRHSSFKIHGISDEMVEEAPSVEEAIVAFADFIGDLPYVAHNVVFDYSFITEAYKKHLGKRFLNPRICSQELYYSLFPEESSHGLSSLARKF